MGYRLLADAVMLVHFGFLAFLAVGGLLARRWRPLIVAHVAAVSWGIYSVVVGVACPLTLAEDRLRRLAGEPGLPGFIDTYLAGVVASPVRQHVAQALLAALVLGSWIRYAKDGRGRAPVRSPAPAGGRTPARPPRSASP